MPKHSSHPTRKASPAKLKVPPGRSGQKKRTSGALKIGTQKSLAGPAAADQGPAAGGSGTARATAAVAVFSRAVVPGRTKTRLIPALGPDGAAEFHRALVWDAFGKVARLKGNVARYVFTAGGGLPEGMVPPAFGCRRQQGSDLGERLGRAFAGLLRAHSQAVIIGTDSPALAPALLRLALRELRVTDSVLGPCPDGGYYLVGLRRICPGLFSGVRMGTQFAFEDTLGSLLRHGLSCSVLEPCPDVDLPQELAALKKSLTRNPAARRLAPHTWRFLSRKA